MLATDHIIDRLLVDITEDVVIRSFHPFGQLHENVIFSDNTVLCPKAGEAPQASWPGEIVLDKRAEGDDQFYDFDSKYVNSDASHVEVPASLPEETLNRVRETAKKAFIAVDGAGLSRVDTFVTADGEVMVNEINTMPGFTPISMYPKAWEATGVSYTNLITMLIEGVLR